MYATEQSTPIATRIIASKVAGDWKQATPAVQETLSTRAASNAS
jgi:hypothetical protein